MKSECGRTSSALDVGGGVERLSCDFDDTGVSEELDETWGSRSESVECRVEVDLVEVEFERERGCSSWR